MGFVLVSCDKKDKCLDGGGHYNESTKECEKDTKTTSGTTDTQITNSGVTMKSTDSTN